MTKQENSGRKKAQKREKEGKRQHKHQDDREKVAAS